jgi:hypothetical protein
MFQDEQNLIRNILHRLPPSTDSTDTYAGLSDRYFSSQVDDTSHTASPLLEFVVDLAQMNSSACDAVLASGCSFACTLVTLLERWVRQSIMMSEQ